MLNMFRAAHHSSSGALNWAFNKRWNNKFYYKVASCWLFLLIHTTMHGSRNMKFELLTGKKLSCHVAESNGVCVIWFVLKNFNIITRISGKKINWKDLKGKGRDVTRPLQGGAGKTHNISKRVKLLIFKAGIYRMKSCNITATMTCSICCPVGIFEEPALLIHMEEDWHIWGKRRSEGDRDLERTNWKQWPESRAVWWH
jgi:hypothetical protein